MSCDFIYGLPGQTVEDVQKMCRDILSLDIQHASLYELSVEAGTPFAAQGVQAVANETCAEMYNAISEKFLPRYEISNYAAPGQECRHNQNIWAGKAYIGIGPSAAGRVFVDGKWFETMDGEILHISDKTRAVEKIITGLRTARGADLTPDVREIIDWEFVENNMKYFRADAGALCIADEYLIFLDSLLPKIIA
jgi:oxygen-independent coproporphyrinogen-3 oxidase